MIVSPLVQKRQCALHHESRTLTAVVKGRSRRSMGRLFVMKQDGNDA